MKAKKPKKAKKVKPEPPGQAKKVDSPPPTNSTSPAVPKTSAPATPKPDKPKKEGTTDEPGSSPPAAVCAVFQSRSRGLDAYDRRHGERGHADRPGRHS